MFDFLARLLAFFYDVWPSYGGAIVLFTLFIMLLLSPLSIKSTRSMIAMQRLQPEMKKLQQKHKGDREALNKEMMAFYQEHKINPFSSCLPLLLQMPVFIVLYRVLTGLTHKDAGSDTFTPDYLDKTSDLYHDLSQVGEMQSFGMDLSKGALGVLQNDGIVDAIPYLILVGIVVLTGFVQQRQVAGRNPNAAANPQQQMIGRIMPFIFIPISISIPAGVVIYFAVSNLVRVGQQALITRLEFREPAAAIGESSKGVIEAKAEEKPAKGPAGKDGGGKAPGGKGAGTRPTNGAKGGRTTPSGNGQRARPTGRTGGGSSSRSRKKKRK